MLSDRRPILFANARIVDPSRNLDIVGDLLIADGVIREAKKGIGAAGVPEGTDVIDCRNKVIAPGLVATGEAVPLFYDPGWNGVRFSQPAQAKGLDMKPFNEFLRDVTGREPQGQLWETYKHALAINAAMQRLVALPPGTPKPAIEAMREAIRKLATDADYAADAMKTVGFVPDYEAGDNVQTEVVNALTIPAEDKEFIADYIARGQKR